MKKVVLVLLTAVGVLAVRKKYDDARAEQALWAEATDDVEKA